MKIPRVGPDEIIKIIKRKGFVLIRQSGSHMIFKNDKGVRITVPYHSGNILHPKIIKSIIIDAELTEEDF